MYIGLIPEHKKKILVLNFKHEHEPINFIVKCCINCAMEDSKLQCRLFVITTLDQIRLKIFLESILFATTLQAVVSPQATRYATTLIK